MASDDLINFDVIESQKENVLSLPGGRSAKQLAMAFSPPLHKLSTPTPTDTKNVNDCIRAEYEDELASISESDDPLDVYDRYVRWTLDAYPSAQATPQSQLHTLLERATKAFIGSNQYKNDPRYLKLWLHYIHLFSDSPRETFVYLSRHGIGEGLALFFEEYAAWLERAGRWAQAEEVYKLGIEREARPQQRLIRKFGEFEQRRAQQPEADTEAPSSPALPTVRPALAAKVDPFAAAAAEAAARDPQAPRPSHGLGGPSQGAKPGRAKMAIFSDAEAAPAAPALSSLETGSKGWQSIGSLADRKKENTMQPKPWVGETLNAGGKKASTKLEIYRDASLVKSHITIDPLQYQVTINPQSGKKERVFVDLQAIYPTPEDPGTELSFAEVWAANRGLLHHCWDDSENEVGPIAESDSPQVNALCEAVPTKLVIHHDVVLLDENGGLKETQREVGRPRKKKVMEVNETQIIKAKLDSPSGPKFKKRGSSEPTMTMHTKAATDDIYEIFNQPIKPVVEEDSRAVSEDDYETDGDYTSGAESTGTTRQITTSEAGDDDEEGEEEEIDEMEGIDAEETSDVKSVSEWSDFTARKHIPNVHGEEEEQLDGHTKSSQLIDLNDSDDEDATVSSHKSAESFEMIDPHHMEGVIMAEAEGTPEEDEDEADLVATPVADELPAMPRTVFIPIPPEDYIPPRRPYRDPAEVANNRLPFMTPITERTESSLEFESVYDGHQQIVAKTPSKINSVDLEPMSSPLLEVVNEEDLPRPPKIAQPRLQKATKAAGASKAAAPLKGPIIKDSQCNPVDQSIRSEILANMQPSLASYAGFYDHSDEKYEKGGEIRKYAKAIMAKGRASMTPPVVVQFPEPTVSQYSIKKELGAGAYAPVYLVENSNPQGGGAVGKGASGGDDDNNDEDAPVVMGKGAFAAAHARRAQLEALKMETPPSAWEFHMMRLAHVRLGPQHRAAASISPALECHLYHDETFLFLPYYPHGSLLDVVNRFRGEPSGAMDEPLVMLFAIELLRTVEALHAKQILHGDLKADNCLVRLDPLSAWCSSGSGSGSGIIGGGSGGSGGELSDGQLASQWRADGAGGWGARGVMLIDLGRAIDMRAFVPDVRFVADWKTDAQDCAEMREGRPWTWQIDYHGLANVLHTLLFGRYLETVRCDAGGIAAAGGRRYRLRDNLKRYWQTDIWSAAFDLLLNPVAAAEASEDNGRMPLLKGMRAVREQMEVWLEANCERGVGLKSLMGKVEGWASKGRR